MAITNYAELYSTYDELKLQIKKLTEESCDSVLKQKYKLYTERRQIKAQLKKQITKLQTQFDKLSEQIDKDHKSLWELNNHLLIKDITTERALNFFGYYIEEKLWRENHINSITSRVTKTRVVNRTSYEVLIQLATTYADLWWSIWSLVLADNSCYKTEDLSEIQFNAIFRSILPHWHPSVKNTVTMLTWLLSDLQDTPKFTAKLPFNAVRQSYMITPNVSLNHLTDCAALRLVTKDQVLELFGNNKKTHTVKETIANDNAKYDIYLDTRYGYKQDIKYLIRHKYISNYTFVRGIKPHRGVKKNCYYLLDENNLYLILDMALVTGIYGSSHWMYLYIPRTTKEYDEFKPYIEEDIIDDIDVDVDKAYDLRLHITLHKNS